MKQYHKKLLLLALGGTIACSRARKGLQPKLRAADLISYVPLPSRIQIEGKDFLKRTIVFPEDWITLTREISNRYAYYDGFIITLGTDTLSYVAAALSLMLQNISKPIVLTGAMHPISDRRGDGQNNLYNAILTASQVGTGRILTVFNGKIIDGNRISKIRSGDIDAFESINAPIVGAISKRKIYWSKPRIRKTGKLIIKPFLDTNVILIKLTPNIQPEFFNKVKGYRGIVIEGYGDGNVSSNLVPILKHLAKTTLVVLASQCPYGRLAHQYEGGVDLIRNGVISAGDMTKEMALVKLMWALGQSTNNTEARKIFTA